MAKRPVRYLIAFGLAALAVGASSRAWACFPYPVVSVQPQASGPSKTEVTVSGVDFETNKVEVRWNALDGPMLGTGQGPNFSVPVTIPEAEDGLYTLFALSRAADDSIVFKSAAVFQITSSGATRPAARAAVPPSPSASASSSDDSSPPVGLLVAGGLGLVALGGLGGLRLGHRRTVARA